MNSRALHTRLTLRNDERAYVMVFVALGFTVFILLMGFAIDVGSWYVQATKLQRAADAAALSGAVQLPSVDGAQAAAMSAFERNGFVNSDTISVDATADSSGNVKTRVTNKAVPTYFLSLLFKSITIKRTSQAQQLTTVPLGSPYNIFGYGDASIGVTGGIPVQNFWAAVNGRCTPKEDGDFFASEWDGNEGTGAHKCEGQATETNLNYNADGYNYAVDIPEAATNTKFDIAAYDPNYAPDNSATPAASRPDVLDKAVGDSQQGFNTAFRVWDTHGTPGESDDTEVWSGTFVNGTSAGNDTWYTMYTTDGTFHVGGLHYRIQVISDPLNDAEGIGAPQTGANAFALMAAKAGTHQGCDSRTDDKCPSVYGMGSISVLNTFSSSNASAGDRTFYLAKIDPTFAGAPIQIYLWDPGEGANSLQLLDPNGHAVPFSWSVNPVYGLPNYSSLGQVTSLDHLNDPGPQPGDPGTRVGTTKFNDRLVTLNVQVPAGYGSDPGDQWWQVKYSFGAGSPGVARTDRTTWGVNVSASTPVHLVEAN